MGGSVNILAIDIGTQCGWALGRRGGAITGGNENFAPAKHGSHGQRWLAFRQFLTDTGRSAGEVHAVYFEDVKRHEGVLAAHAYGGFLAMLQAWCATNRIPMYPVGVGAIKKNWTGKGNANKALMIESAKARGHHPVDDNHADALAILSFARAQEGKPEVLPF
jgi:crossover junction endodeoxyribonuclease RuvC